MLLPAWNSPESPTTSRAAPTPPTSSFACWCRRSDYAIYLLDVSGRVASWNPGAERIKGYRAGEVTGRHFSLFYTAEDRAAGKPEQALGHAAREGRFQGEGWRQRKDGSRFWAEVTLTALRDASGALKELEQGHPRHDRAPRRARARAAVRGHFRQRRQRHQQYVAGGGGGGAFMWYR